MTKYQKVRMKLLKAIVNKKFDKIEKHGNKLMALALKKGRNK